MVSNAEGVIEPHGGERENEVKSDYFKPASPNGPKKLLPRLLMKGVRE